MMRKRRLKIGIFDLTPINYYGGGCENSFIKIAGALSDRGHEVIIITPTLRFFKIFVFLLEIFYRIRIKLKPREDKKSIIKRLKKAKWVTSPFYKIRSYLQKQDVIYTKNEILELFMLNFLFIRRPIISSVRTPLFYPLKKSVSAHLHNWLYSSKLHQFLCRILQGAHVLNKQSQNDMRQILPSEKVFLVPNWVNTDFFKSKIENKIRREAKFNILFVGRLSEQKGIRYLRKIIKSLIHNKDINFIIVGHGELESIIKKLSQRHSNIEWFKELSTNQLLDVYQKSHLFILPSRWESLPLVVLEAQSCGLPVVAFDIPGLSDIIINNKTGYLIELKNTDRFISAIERIFNLYAGQPKSYNDLCNRCRENIINKFPKSKILQYMENMFLKIVEDR